MSKALLKFNVITTTYGFVRSMVVIERRSAMRAAVVKPPGRKANWSSKDSVGGGTEERGVEILFHDQFF